MSIKRAEQLSLHNENSYAAHHSEKDKEYHLHPMHINETEDSIMKIKLIKSGISEVKTNIKNSSNSFYEGMYKQVVAKKRPYDPNALVQDIFKSRLKPDSKII